MSKTSRYPIRMTAGLRSLIEEAASRASSVGTAEWVRMVLRRAAEMELGRERVDEILAEASE